MNYSLINLQFKRFLRESINFKELSQEQKKSPLINKWRLHKKITSFQIP